MPGADHGPRDLGDEPPLSVDGPSGAPIDRRRISLRWLSGTVLTGVCGAALMGGAVYASLDGEAKFAASPERVEPVVRGTMGSVERVASSARKADRLQPVVETNLSRQILRVSTTAKVGDREVMRVRPFVRVAANLSLASTELSANIPAFNANRLMASAGPDAPVNSVEEAPAAEPDAEVSSVMRDLGPILTGRAKLGPLLRNEDILASVRAAAEWSGAGSAPVALYNAPQGNFRLAYAAEGDVDPYAGFESRIIPENVTLLPKTAHQATGGNSWNERTITVKKGDSVSAVLRDLGASAEEVKAVTSALGARGRDGGLKDGQKLRVLLSQSSAGARMQPIRVIIVGEASVEAVVALSDTGKYVAVDVQGASVDVQTADADDDEDDQNTIRLYRSLYETALRNQIPRPMIDELVRIYAYDVDFQRKVQPGDSFEVFFASDDEAPNERNEVLFASLTVGGETKRFYRHQSADDGVVDYYDETGKSAKKFLVRKPMGSGIMRSGYGWRRHPILGYSKMHTGVDWAAPRGTPIYSSGNGTIEKAGWESGYGKYVRVRHANGYVTAYGHMSAFARGMSPGVRVRQGQLIGYVGSTGLSTGPHLHYEILVNGRFVDPMRIKLPRGRVLEGPALASFERERERVDGLMTRAGSRMAQTTR